MPWVPISREEYLFLIHTDVPVWGYRLELHPDLLNDEEVAEDNRRANMEYCIEHAKNDYYKFFYRWE